MTMPLIEVTDDLDTSTLERELGRFFRIAEVMQEQGQQALMPSSYVDTYWHRLNESGQIGVFVENIFGEGTAVNHLEMQGYGELDWVRLYHAEHGKLDRVWFYDPNGVFDAAKYDEYEVGVGDALTASWDCGPAILPKMSWDCGPGIVKG